MSAARLQVRRFALARMMETQRDVDDLQATLAMPLTVVRLTLPFDEIARRLSLSVTAGRQDDLAEAERQVAEGRGDTVGDLTFENTSSIRDVALEIVTAVGW